MKKSLHLNCFKFIFKELCQNSKVLLRGGTMLMSVISTIPFILFAWVLVVATLIKLLFSLNYNIICFLQRIKALSIHNNVLC